MAGDERLRSLAGRTAADDGVLIDLTDVRHIDPLHLVGVAALAHDAWRRRHRLELRLPVEEHRRYAARMRLGRILDSLGAVHDLPTVAERDQRGSLLEISMISDRGEARTLAALVGTKLRATAPGLAGVMHAGVAEIGDNVCIHSGTVGFVAAQTMHRAGELRFAVADAGVGLLATLRGRGADDDRSAIALALSGISEIPGPGHGTGLRTTLEAVRELAGELYVASGGASSESGSGAARWSGTLVEATVPLSH